MYPTSEQNSAKAYRSEGIASAGSRPPDQQITIQSGLDLQDSSLVQLHETISELESRLALVLGPPNDPIKGEGGNQVAPPSQILPRIAMQRHVTEMATNRLVSLTRRLHI